MDILNYPIAIAVTTTIVIEKILIQDVGFSLQYAPSIKTTGWKMLSCNSARPCVFASCAVWRSTSLSWPLNAELSLAIASYFQLLTLYHVWTSLSIYQPQIAVAIAISHPHQPIFLQHYFCQLAKCILESTAEST